MRGKPVTTHWHTVEQAVKVGTTAWSIVFAAVVAQCKHSVNVNNSLRLTTLAFKTYATWRVERGIKLMRLEQLVGSNSFGSAMKQPFVLRRLDTLTLAIFLAWCFSPLGSYALQRILVEKQPEKNSTGELWYLNTKIQNPMFSVNSPNRYNETYRSEQLQPMVTLYQGTFLPVSERSETASMFQDLYDNPLIYIPFDYVPPSYWNVSGNTPSTVGAPSQYGVPFLVPDTAINYTNATSDADWNKIQVYTDIIYFAMNTTFFNFTCDDWSTRQWNQDLTTLLNLDVNTNYGFGMTVTNASSSKYNSSTANYLAFGSHNRDLTNIPSINNTKPLDPDPTWEFSFIECLFEPVHVALNMNCSRDYTSNFDIVCSADEPNITYATAQERSENIFFDFTYEWLVSTVPGIGVPFALDDSKLHQDLNASVTLTPIVAENFLILGNLIDNINSSNTYEMSNYVTPWDFSWYFGYLFNTWVQLGLCPDCVWSLSDGNSAPPDPDMQSLYVNATNTLKFTYFSELAYENNNAWLAVYLTCCCLLLIAGVVSILFESVTVAPDILGYASNVARNNRYLHLPPTTSDMRGSERIKVIGDTEVMMQDAKANAEVGKIVLGNKHEKAHRLKPGRVYR